MGAVSSLGEFRLRGWQSCVGYGAACSSVLIERRYVTQDVTQHLWNEELVQSLGLKVLMQRRR